MGVPALGRPLLPDRAPRPEELRHEFGVEPRAHDPAAAALARDRARDRSADGAGDLQRVDQRRAQQDDDGTDPRGDERDHAHLRREDRCGAEGDRGGAGQGDAPPAAGHEQPLPRRLRGRSCELLADPQARPRALLKRDARRAAAAAAELERARPQIAATIAANRRKIAVWRSAEAARSRTGSPRSRPTATSRPPGGARPRREGESGCDEVRRVLPCVPDRDRPGRAHAQAHPSLQHRRRLRADAAALRANDLVEVHRLQQRATVLTRRITLEAQAAAGCRRAQDSGRDLREPELEATSSG